MDVLHYLNGWAALACCIGFGYIAWTNKIKEGLIIKVGLSLVSIGSLVTALLILRDYETFRGLLNAGFVTRCGMLLVLVGVVLRIRAGRGKHRRRSDAPPKLMERDELHHVAGGKGGA